MYANDMSLSLKSDTFSALKEDFDSILARTIGNMEMRGAEEATVTLKLGISLEKSSVNGPNGLQDITKPSFKHDISSVMQVKDKKSGALTGDYELVWDESEGKYVMRRIDNGQTSIFDRQFVYADADYTALPEGRRELPEAAQEGDDNDETPDTEDGENDEPDAASEPEGAVDDTSTPFGWLKQFVGMEMRVTEAMGNYTVRTDGNKVVLSSATNENSPFYCHAEKLAPHVGHKVSCVGYGDDANDLVNISIECEDCSQVLYDLDAPEETEAPEEAPLTEEEIAEAMDAAAEIVESVDEAEEGPDEEETGYDYDSPEE